MWLDILEQNPAKALMDLEMLLTAVSSWLRSIRWANWTVSEFTLTMCEGLLLKSMLPLSLKGSKLLLPSTPLAVVPDCAHTPPNLPHPHSKTRPKDTTTQG